jgi:hypothetical protein
MRRLLGLFAAREEGLRTLERLRAAGFEVQTIENATDAAESSRDATAHRERDQSAGAATGGVLGALAGGVIGAVPGALLGALAGHGLSEVNASRHERVVAAGGIALVVDAPEIIPAAQAEDMLREGGAVHVHTGEIPRA